MITRFLRWLVGAEPAFVALDRVTLQQATDFTAQELEGAIVSVTKVEAWQVKREQRVREMQADLTEPYDCDTI